jgi:Holliday junction resolvase
VKLVNKVHDDFLKGGIFKELIKSLLLRSGYEVYPYGYETTFSILKNRLSAGDVRNSPSVRRMKYTPDLVVFDKNNQDLMFVEVKMRSQVPAIIKSSQVEGYQTFWNDCILVLVVQDENVFYAQRVSVLQKKEYYNPATDFSRMRELFTGVDENDLQHYRILASSLFSSMTRLK